MIFVTAAWNGFERKLEKVKLVKSEKHLFYLDVNRGSRSIGVINFSRHTSSHDGDQCLDMAGLAESLTKSFRRAKTTEHSKGHPVLLLIA